MAEPSVGAESDEYRAVCLYSDRPGSPRCGEPAVLHIGVEDTNYGSVADYGLIALATCSRHAPMARASARFVNEHAFEGFCGFPATRWDMHHNRCVLDDSGQEPSRVEHAESVVSG